MPAAGDPVALLSKALDQTGSVISRVRPEQAALPTPCRSWDVRSLVNHVVHDVQMFTVVAKGGRRERDEGDVIGDDWSAAYRQSAASLLAVWRRPGALEGTRRLPFGEVPASWQVYQVISDLAVHAWDVAKATGQPTDLEPEVGQAALDWGRENLKPQFRGDEASGQSFGPEVPVPDGAPLYDRLAGFWGRDPG
jgi:uncharacterized protein (TIGR03086 family)